MILRLPVFGPACAMMLFLACTMPSEPEYAGGVTDNPSSRTAVVSGILRSSEGHLARGANVSMYPADYRAGYESRVKRVGEGVLQTTISDETGYFEFENVGAGELVIAGEVGDDEVFLRKIDSAANNDTLDLDTIQAVRPGAVEGNVATLSDDRFFVSLIGLDRATQTDSAGRFYFGKVAPGSYTLSIINEHMPARSRVTIDEVFVRSDSTTHISPIAIPVLERDTFYVAPAGNDTQGDGSVSNPFQTLHHAMHIVPPEKGKVVFCFPGTYDLTEKLSIPPGVALVGSGKDQTILRTTAHDIGIWLQTKSAPFSTYGNEVAHLTLRGDRSGTNGVYSYGRHYVRLRHLRVESFLGAGLRVAGCYNTDHEPNPFLRGMEIAHCEVRNCSSAEGNDLGGAAVTINGWNGGTIHNNAIDQGSVDSLGAWAIRSAWGGGFRGMHIYNNTFTVPSFSRAVQLENCDAECLVYANVSNSGYMIKSKDGSPPSGGAFRVRLSGNRVIQTGEARRVPAFDVRGSHVEIGHNVIEGCKGILTVTHAKTVVDLTVHHNLFIGDGSGKSAFALWAESGTYLDHINIVNNTIDSCFEAFRIQVREVPRYIGAIRFSNNCALRLERGILFAEMTEYIGQVQITNNVLHPKEILLLNNRPIPEANLVWENNTELQTSEEAGLTDIGATPEERYRPAHGSILVDSGTVFPPYTNGYSGIAPDIGAFERD